MNETLQVNRVQVQSSRFGEVSVAPETVLSFPGGLLGYPLSTRYVLLKDDRFKPFLWLQSVDEPALAFVVAPAHDFASDYHARIAEVAAHGPEAAAPLVLILMTMAPRPDEITANLQGPLVIDPVSGAGRQLVLDGDVFRTKHRLVDLLSAAPADGVHAAGSETAESEAAIESFCGMVSP